VANAELSRPPKEDRFELLVVPERSEGKEFDTAQLRMVVRCAAPSSLRMIIRSIVEAARGLDNGPA